MSELRDLPLFLLNTVLHSGGRLELRVFETRYMDMVKDCLRHATPFGVCLLARGDEVVGTVPAEPHAVGTLARIIDWDMPQMGILNIVVQGEGRFRIHDHHIAKDGVTRAKAEMLPEPKVTPIPGDYARLVPLLRGLLEALEEDMPPKPHRFYDAAWVADRWAELLPLPLLLRQNMLEMDDGVVRLEAIYHFLEEKSEAPD